MVEGVDERQSRGTIEGSSIIQGGGDAHRRLVDVGDTKVDFPHRCKIGDRTREAKGESRTVMRRWEPNGGRRRENRGSGNPSMGIVQERDVEQLMTR